METKHTAKILKFQAINKFFSNLNPVNITAELSAKHILLVYNV